MKQSSTRRKEEFVRFQDVAASFEAEAREKGWNSEDVSAKRTEVQQSWEFLLDFIDETQAQLQELADRLKVRILYVARDC